MAVSDYRILTITDICTLLECSETQAKRIKKDIQTELNIKFVLFKHFQSYFKTN